MKNLTDKTIIKTLMSSSKQAAPDDMFIELLQSRLAKELGARPSFIAPSLLTKILNILIVSRENYLRLGISLSLLFIMVVAGIIYWQWELSRNDEDQSPRRETAQQPVKNDKDDDLNGDPNDDLAAGGTAGISLALPVDVVPNVEAAQSRVNFNIRLPQAKIGGESLTEVRVGQNFADVDHHNVVYLVYNVGERTNYRITQSAKDKVYVAEGGTSVTINSNGKELQARYYVIEGWNPGSIQLLGEGELRSYLQWEDNGVVYEVAEFGDLNRDQLLQLASSI